MAALEGSLDPAFTRALPAMTAALKHRGPDGDGLFTSAAAALGHRRLAIIDRVGGTQPMTNEDGSCWIVFNGEVYNHAVLRAQLIGRGHVFRTTSDTEAILHAYEEYGTDCVDKLEGMFAFAIYDTRRRTLFAARDRIGKKPFFYAVLGGVLHFASEIKAFYPSPAWDDALDLSSLEGYVSLGYFLAPDTIYRQVHKLPAGHWLLLRDGQITIRQYWDVTEFDSDGRQEDAVLADVESTLHETVTERLESEVPLGAFLSGGIDSGLVVAVMSGALGTGLVTASVGFGDVEHNELDAARCTAEHFHTRHYPALITPQLDQVLDPIVGAFDEPFADASAIPTYYVSQNARRHVTVALSGDGGDEVFGGYDFRYVPHAVESLVRPWLPARPALAWLGARWPRSPRLPRALRLSTILENLGGEPVDAYYSDLCLLKPYEARLLLGRAPVRDARDSPVFEAVTAPYRRCPSPSAVQRAQYADLKGYLANDVLVKVDRMSMLHSLEVRCPLLDRRLVELAFRVPSRTKMPRLQPKHLLRALARKVLPRELLTLPKHGFSAPVGAWLAGPYANQFADEVLGQQSHASTLLDTGVVRRWFDEHRAGSRDRSQPLWMIWMLERWGRSSRRVSAQTAALALTERV